MCHRAAPPLHHKDRISFKDIHVCTSSTVVQILLPHGIDSLAVRFSLYFESLLISTILFYMLTARQDTVAALTRRFSSLIWLPIL